MVEATFTANPLVEHELAEPVPRNKPMTRPARSSRAAVDVMTPRHRPSRRASSGWHWRLPERRRSRYVELMLEPAYSRC